MTLYIYSISRDKKIYCYLFFRSDEEIFVTFLMLNKNDKNLNIKTLIVVARVKTRQVSYFGYIKIMKIRYNSYQFY